ADGADAVYEVLRTAVAQVVAVDTGDDDVAQVQRGNRLREIERFLRVERQRTPVADIAEGAAPRAEIAHDHERRRALAEAFADVRARGLFAHRVQAVLAQDLLDLGKARRRWRAHADPVGLFQALGRDDFDRVFGKYGRRLRRSGVLDAGGIGRRRARRAHEMSSKCLAMTGASSAPASATVRAMPRSASCVTASPLSPQGSMSA